MRMKQGAGVAAAVAIAMGLFAGASAQAAPQFVNGLVLPGDSIDRAPGSGANQNRLGFFSDLYYDPQREEWWAVSDRGPGGGLIDYATRVQKLDIDFDEKTGAIKRVRVKRTVKFTDPRGLLAAPDNPAIGEPKALNGLNPLGLNGDVAVLGRSFDPEGFVIDPRGGNFIVSDEYGPAVYAFDRDGRLIRRFETPANLVPKLADGTSLDYVSDRAVTRFGRQDNRGFEGVAVTPSGKRVLAVLQDPLVNEPGPNNGRDGRNVRVVVFDNDIKSKKYGTAIAQYVYQLEKQADVAARIVAAGGVATATDPRQGRNLGLSAITAINDHEFFVLERDNRGIGVDDPAGANVVGSKQIFKIDITGATDVTALALPAGDLPATITPVSKSPQFLDLATVTLLPNGKRLEKWEGFAIGPRLKNGNYVLLAGNDNDYSVTQTGEGAQFDVYVNFTGGSVQRDLDQPTKLNGVDVGPVPTGYSLLPAVLHAFRASAADIGRYVPPYGADDDHHGHGHDGKHDHR